jgi:hypothetical protein
MKDLKIRKFDYQHCFTPYPINSIYGGKKKGLQQIERSSMDKEAIYLTPSQQIESFVLVSQISYTFLLINKMR